MTSRNETTRRGCGEHPRAPAIARCTPCGARMCDACFELHVAGDPWCARCAYEALTRSRRRLSLAVAFELLALGLGALLLPAASRDADGELFVYILLGEVIALALAVFIGVSGRSGERPAIEHRNRAEEEPPARQDAPGHPYRARLTRALTAAAPKLSGSATAAVVLVSFAATALLVPAVSPFPRWIEAELVVGAWWLLLFGTLAVLLYRGYRLRDDLVYFPPWDRPAEAWAREPAPSQEGVWAGFSWRRAALEGCSFLDVLSIGAVIAVLLGVAWLLVEIALPMAFILLYATFMRAIGRVANQRHECEGLVGDTLVWAGLWASLYTAPLALLVLLLRVAGVGV